MKSILENPYRIIGLLVGASAREQDRQVRRLKQYLEAEQEPEADYSFPILGKLPRTISDVENSVSKLNLDNDKINASLFWFYNGNPITDEPAFESLKEGNTETAIEIWKKLAYDLVDESYNEVTKRNASAFQNLSTLYLSEYGIDEDTLQLKLRFLESDFVNDFKAKTTDETFKITKKELQLSFLNNLIQQNDFNPSELIDAIGNIDFSAKQDFLKGFVKKPIEQIERLIEESKTKRKANKASSANNGYNLHQETTENLQQLKSILGTSDIKFTSISDKVAEEILQCGIDYFKHYRDSSTDPGSTAMGLFRKAKTLAFGSVAKQRIQENTENLQEWIDEKPERDKQKKVADDLQFITSKLERFQNLSDSISNAKDLVDSCKPKLANIKNVLGSTDGFYLKISGAVANNALGMLISVINDEQNSYGVRIGEFSSLRSVVRSALEVSNTIGTFDMQSQQRSHYNQNHSTLKSIASQLGVGTSSYSSSSSGSGSYRPTTTKSSNSSDNEGCASWVYWVVGIIIFIALIRACN